MITVVHFCNKDAENCIANLEQSIRWDGQTQFEALLAYDQITRSDYIATIESLARKFFSVVNRFVYDPPHEVTWPQAQNHAFQRVAWHFQLALHKPFFWWEADAVPIRPGWLKLLWDEYKSGGKPFMGHLVDGMGHMNGCAFYPWNIADYCPTAMYVRNCAWDVVLGTVLNGHVHRANHLIQHCWNIDENRIQTNGAGKAASFTNWEEVAKLVDFNRVLFHRCKDASLLKLIHEHNIGKDKEEDINVGRQVPLAEPKQRQRKSKQVTKTTAEILIVTYRKDFPWLEWCLKGLKRHLTGHSGITLAIPDVDVELALPLSKRYDVKLWPYDEVPGKGMVQHMGMIMSADLIVPYGTEYVIHLDSDCIYHCAANLDSYFTKGKPDWVVRTYESLTDKEHKVTSDCAQWGPVAEKALGFFPEMYTMCRHPTVFPVILYRSMRQHIEGVVKKPFMDWVLEQKNEFPQTMAEFPTMGAWAWRFHPNHFNWIDISTMDIKDRPPDLQKTFYSHGGISTRIREEMERFVA